MQERAWTLILWDIENVPVPSELQDLGALRQLKNLLSYKFGKARHHHLDCIKVACKWHDHQSPHARLLGNLTTLEDVEVLGYHWQGHTDKLHNADRLLKQAADRFMRMHAREAHHGPQHLVVFITSDQDFHKKILGLQRKGFRVVVLFHKGRVSQRATSIVHAADEAYDWLSFLAQGLYTNPLTICQQPINMNQPIQEPGSSMQWSASAVKNSQTRQSTLQQQADASQFESAAQDESGPQVYRCDWPDPNVQNLFAILVAVEKSHMHDTNQLTRVVARSCLMQGSKFTKTGLQFLPVGIAVVEKAVDALLPKQTEGLLLELASEECRPYFDIVNDPMSPDIITISPKIPALIATPCMTPEVEFLLAHMQCLPVPRSKQKIMVLYLYLAILIVGFLLYMNSSSSI